MVCRENKARSAVMGLEKHLLANMNGGRREPDHVFQSAIHEYGHSFEAVDNPTPEQYHSFLVGFRQQLVSNPNITDADKFRQSHKQPGLVTRIDQEIERVRSGKDENGRPLRPEQINGGKHFAAMQRMSTLLTRQVTARNAYVENYARQTGKSVPEAMSRWDDLCSRKPEQRENTRISLTDNWQQDLAVSGLTSQHQSDLTQSNVARDAVAVMEHERKLNVGTLPSKPSITDAQRTKAITTEQAKGMVKCDECGQFGHEGTACPNGKELQALHDANHAYYTAREAHDAASVASLKAQLDDNADKKGAFAAQAKAEKDLNRAERDLAKSQAAFEQARGPLPLVSDAVTSVGYDKDTGLLEVTRPGYTRKSDGVTVEPKAYLYRMAPDQYDDMMASGSVGKYLAQTTGSKEHEAYKWENPAEAREATMKRQCPTCGQWASMTSQHQCPTPGSMDSTEEAHYRERVRVARERASLEQLPVQIGETTRRRRVLAQSHANLAQGGVARFPEVNQMTAIRGRGEVGVGPVTVQYLGQQVTGKAYTWKDPRTGQAYTTLGQVSCTCKQRETCSHREHAGNAVAAAYRSQRIVNATPGTSVMRSHDEGTGQRRTSAVDAPDGPIARRSYQRIRQDREEARGALQKTWAAHPDYRARATAPVDAKTGRPVPSPQSYTPTNGSDERVDTGSGFDTASATAGFLNSRSGQDSSSMRWVAVSDGGGFRVTSGAAAMGRDGKLTPADQRELGQLMGLRGRAHEKGYYVADDNGSRYEAVSRAERGSSDILGARYVAGAGQAYGPEV